MSGSFGAGASNAPGLPTQEMERTTLPGGGERIRVRDLGGTCVMASLNSPIAEYFPKVDVEVGNELFWYIFKGEPVAQDGYIRLSDDLPGLGLEIDEAALLQFEVTQ